MKIYPLGAALLLHLLLIPTSPLPLRAQAPAGSVTIDDYRERVLAYSHQLKQSEDQVELLHEAVRMARAARMPTWGIGASADYRLEDYDLELGGSSISMSRYNYTVQAPLQQSIYEGGRLRLTQQSAQIEERIAHEAVLLTRNHLIEAAERNYWMAVAYEAMLGRIDTYVAIIDTLERVVTDRFLEGQISRTDLLQVQTRRTEAEVELSEARRSSQLALQRLNILMGAAPDTQTELLDSITAPIRIPYQLSLADAMSLRPEQRITSLNYAYQQKQISQARSRYNPSLRLTLQPTWGTQLLNFDGQTQFQAYASATLSIPLFAGGARHRAVALERVRLREVAREELIVQDQISEELSAAWSNLTAFTAQLHIAQQHTALAEENLMLNTFSYNEGQLPIIDVLLAQATWIESYTQLIATALAQRLALVEYRVAAGFTSYDPSHPHTTPIHPKGVTKAW